MPNETQNHAPIKKHQSCITIATDETTIYNKIKATWSLITYLRADIGGHAVDNVFLDMVECSLGNSIVHQPRDYGQW